MRMMAVSVSIKVKNSERYLRRVKVKATKYQESDFTDIVVEDVGKMCFNLGLANEYQDEGTYTIRELLTMIIEKCDSQLNNKGEVLDEKNITRV